ncbi:amino acid ABC transporter permease [Litchfieldella qijiaojingensis]|uniref:Amino acid ABC transporter permease n=1 Tax=Litchfieldella qijiaojingensis TaxID=980347 RepID=A0ABQ2Z9S0_9GAMM|nr:amino acid ABC transporter permease [Halomonas qijiaojingensis]GGY09644.1 amino acid ABC transporter permease [Halomonas qijiaojingensis]
MVFDTLVAEFPFLLRGLWIGVQLLAALLALGFVLGLTLAVMSVYGHWTLRLFTVVFERIFRGIPEIVLLLLFFYGIGELLPLSPFLAAVLALGLRSTAYQAQIFRGSIQSVAGGEVMAARALGMSRLGAIWHIVLPQALRRSIGPWTNEYSAELKATSLAYVIGVVELTRQASYIVSNLQGNTLTVFAVVAAMYFVVNRLGNAGLYALERKLAVPGFEGRGASS